MQATPGRDSRSYAEIQKYLQNDYSSASFSGGLDASLDENSTSTMTRVLSRLNRSQASVDGAGVGVGTMLSLSDVDVNVKQQSSGVTSSRKKKFSRRASATAEYTDMLQQRERLGMQLQQTDEHSKASVSAAATSEPDSESVLRKYLGNKGTSGSGGMTHTTTRESLVKSGVLKDLRGKLASTEQKLRVAQAELVTKGDEVRKLIAKCNRLEKEKSSALQKQVDALPKSSRKHAKASIWSKLEMDTKKRDTRFSQILQHYEILEGQYEASRLAKEELESEMEATRDQLRRRETDCTSLREELTSMSVREQKSRLEFLECIKSLQVLKRSHESCQEECKDMSEKIESQSATIEEQRDELEKLKKLQEKTLKDKVKRDHKISVLQKRLKASAMEIDVLKKTQDTYETDYYNLEGRMKVLRKRNSFLEVNLDKANRISDDAKKTVEMKEEECKLMASIINDSRRRTISSTSSFAPQFSFDVGNNNSSSSGGGGNSISKGKEVVSPMRRNTTSGIQTTGAISPVNLFKRNAFGSGANNARRGVTSKSIEDELAELVVSPDSLDSQDEDDSSQDEEEE